MNRDLWVSETLGALRSLLANFATYNEAPLSHDGWSVLTPDDFPCQKSGADLRCEGWAGLSQTAQFTPGQMTSCPCSRGRHYSVAPLFGAAFELSSDLSPSELKKGFRATAFRCFANDSELRSHLALWLHWAEERNFEHIYDTDWIADLSKLSLTAPQSLTLRWWSRILDLSRLVHNQAFTILTRSTLERLYRQGQSVLLQRALSQLSLKAESLVVLYLNGSELSSSTNQSARLDWLDALFSALDEQGMGLAVLSKHPLFISTSVPSDSSERSAFRWKSARRQSLTPLPFERLLLRGSWDRFLELLARGDHILRQIR